ncbi:hypothetical protein SKAU_G00215990 [Synaphobranchus kaupii]|uniref:Uncharacterized protein n=1 Tax=Synaphobranchus kaupii TaxID=118154 RepID=A0A9Q1IUI5_SYNKA|nr:hypothetical protein SKAU_G00215990 [Synaphobranchus kaupii]
MTGPGLVIDNCASLKPGPGGAERIPGGNGGTEACVVGDPGAGLGRVGGGPPLGGIGPLRVCHTRVAALDEPPARARCWGSGQLAWHGRRRRQALSSQLFPSIPRWPTLPHHTRAILGQGRGSGRGAAGWPGPARKRPSSRRPSGNMGLPGAGRGPLLAADVGRVCVWPNRLPAPPGDVLLEHRCSPTCLLNTRARAHADMHTRVRVPRRGGYSLCQGQQETGPETEHAQLWKGSEAFPWWRRLRRVLLILVLFL